MESTRTKVEVMKPVLLKAGIPLAITVAGFIFARLTRRRRSSVSKAFHSENQVNSQTADSREEFRDEESFHSLDSMSFPCMEDEEQHIVTGTHLTNPLACLLNRDKSDIEEEILGPRCQIEELQEREWRLETQFLQYCNMKEQEFVLKELQNNLLVEVARVDFLSKEISSMEAENRRFEELVVECLRILEQLEFARLENGLLHKKVKKLSRKTRGLSRAIGEQNMQIEAREAEDLRNRAELERKTNVVKALEDEITDLQNVMYQLQLEKKELLNKLEFAENSASSKIEAVEGITLEDYKQLVNELEQVQRNRAEEAKELISLRWGNACLKHELMRRNQEQEEQTEERNNSHLELEFGGSGEIGHFGSENDSDGSVLGHGEPCLGVSTGAGHAHSKGPKLIRKLKRWVEGSEKVKQKSDGKDQKHGVKCFRRTPLVSEGAEELHLPPKKSCSTA